MINMIKRDPTEIIGWFEWELMKAWQNLFPLTETSCRTGFLPLSDEAWSSTLDPWWRFLMDRPTIPTITLVQSRQTSSHYLSEESLTELKVQDVEPVITERKILKNTPVECKVLGHVHRVKLIQFSMPVIRGTMVVRTNQVEMGILNHAVMIFLEEIYLKQVLMERWRWREMGNHTVVELFGRFLNPHPIMNIIIWNCKGALKPKFKQMVADLISWHNLVVMVIIETRVSDYRAEEVIKGLPFDGFAILETIGFTGGIWLLWNSFMVHVEVLSLIEQEIHALLQVQSLPSSWILSAIYASPKFKNRCILWENLEKVSDHHDLLWILMGDFNEVLEESEKFGGNSLNVRRVREYIECMKHCNLLDLGFSGLKFTWTNKRGLRNLIQEWLDRCWANPSYKAFFSEASVSYLARINSDHCPLLLKIIEPPSFSGE